MVAAGRTAWCQARDARLEAAVPPGRCLLGGDGWMVVIDGEDWLIVVNKFAY